MQGLGCRVWGFGFRVQARESYGLPETEKTYLVQKLHIEPE